MHSFAKPAPGSPLDRRPLHSLTPFYITSHGSLSPPCAFGGCSENQRVDCFLFVCKTSSRYPASVHVALKFDTSMLHDEMLSLCAFCIQCFVNIFVPIKIQRVTGFQSIDACMVDAGCRSRAIGHSACILCSVIRMKFQCDRALGMHVFHAFNLQDEYMFIQFLPIFLIFTLDCTTLHACLHHRLRVTLAVLM